MSISKLREKLVRWLHPKCDCPSLQLEAPHADSPFRYEPDKQRYYFTHGERSTMRGFIDFCPFCGGRVRTPEDWELEKRSLLRS
jgi:hypothetical protein